MPHISKSQLEQLMSCPKLYWYERYQGVGGKTSLAMLLGGSYHAIWEQFYRTKMSHGKTMDIEWAKDTFADEFTGRIKAEVESDNLEFEKGEDNKIKDIGIGLMGAYHPYAIEIEPLFVEKQYELSIPGHDWTLYGYIDLGYKSYLVDSDGKPVIDSESGEQKWVPVVVDHKTSSSSPYDVNKPGRYDDWLQINTWNHEAIGYALAYRVMFGRTEDRFEYHYAIKTKEPRILISPIKVGEQQIRWYLDLAVEQIERIKRGYFERNLTSWKHTPKFCPAWDQCHGIVVPTGKKGTLKVV